MPSKGRRGRGPQLEWWVEVCAADGLWEFDTIHSTGPDAKERAFAAALEKTMRFAVKTRVVEIARWSIQEFVPGQVDVSDRSR